MNSIILYYNFTPIENPTLFCKIHKEKCAALGLQGRVYVSSEGINGTLAGEKENISAYKSFLLGLNGFEDTEFKEELTEEIPFSKLIVKVRPEIVTLKTDIPLKPKVEGGGYLEPHEWKQQLESGGDYTLLDVRNGYESRIGHFDGAIIPEVQNFFDFPQWLDQTPLDKNKKVLMYCTGGIRCEKFSVLMKKKGFKEVYQLHGGILNYAQKEQGKYFKGKCFVFDDRLAVAVNPVELEPISRCEISDVPCDSYINCANPPCNKLFLCSKASAIEMQGCCSEVCKDHPDRRPLDIEKIYSPYRKWYNYSSTKSKKGTAV